MRKEMTPEPVQFSQGAKEKLKEAVTRYRQMLDEIFAGLTDIEICMILADYFVLHRKLGKEEPKTDE